MSDLTEALAPTTPDEALDLIGRLAHVPIREQRRPDQVRAYAYALDHAGAEREAVEHRIAALRDEGRSPVGERGGNLNPMNDPDLMDAVFSD